MLVANWICSYVLNDMLAIHQKGTRMTSTSAISPTVAAAVDGAGSWRRFWHITLPGLKHIIIITTLLTFIFTLNDFNIIYVMTRGGPGTATQVFATYSYEVAFNQLRWGRGVTISIFAVPLLIAGIALVSRYLLRERTA